MFNRSSQLTSMNPMKSQCLNLLPFEFIKYNSFFYINYLNVREIYAVIYLLDWYKFEVYLFQMFTDRLVIEFIKFN